MKGDGQTPTRKEGAFEPIKAIVYIASNWDETQYDLISERCIFFLCVLLLVQLHRQQLPM